LADDDADKQSAKEFLDKLEEAMDRAIEIVHELARTYQDLNMKTEVADTLKEIDGFEYQYEEVVSLFNKTFSETGSLKSETEKEDRHEEIGKDMWKQLQRVTIPVFTGETRAIAVCDSYPHHCAL